jgi:acyl-CoA synthetase (NDP forming)
MGPAWYDSESIKGIVQAALEDTNMDAIILCIMFASANRASVGLLSALLLQRSTEKPILCCFASPEGIWDEEIRLLEQSGIPNYSTPERAAKSLANLVHFRKMAERGNTRENR